MFNHLEQIIISYAEHMPLEIFSPVVSFLEEIIPPIPSPSVMFATGSMALIQGYLLPGLIILALLGAVGKTLGASVAYFVADKVEDLLSVGISKFIGITHSQIESFGSRLGKGSRDYIILTVLRALPVVPSSLLSVGCGLLKVKFRLFLFSTFIGSIIRDFIYIYLGYAGTEVAVSFLKRTTNTESFVKIVVVFVVLIGLGFVYLKRKKAKL
jgi:membrane protein DedA with SNARE-associated domain